MTYTKVAVLLSILLVMNCCKNSTKDTNDTENKILNLPPLTETQSSIDSVLELVKQTKFNADQEFKRDIDSQVGHSLWRDSIPSILKENSINNILFTGANKELIDLSTVKKPIFIQVSSTHSNVYKTELPVTNRLAEEYKNDIKFIVLLCDGIEKYNKKKDDYYEGISIVTTKDINCDSNINIQGFKHLTGYPFNYYLSEDLEIINCEIGDLEYDNSETYAEYRQRIYEMVKGNLELLIEKKS